MDDLVRQAADVLVPMLVKGAEATAEGVAEEGGARVFGTVLEKVRRRLGRGRAPDRAEVQRALQAAVADGEVTEAELSAVLSVQTTTTTIGDTYNVGDIEAGRDIFFGGTFNDRRHRGG